MKEFNRSTTMEIKYEQVSASFRRQAQV